MTIFLIILSIFVSGGLSFFQYFYKNKSISKTTYVLAAIRFFIVFFVLLLLINPIFSTSSYEIKKTPLAIAIDNSSSVVSLQADKTAKEVFEKLIENTDLNKKFDVQQYQFDSDFQSQISLNFKGKQTDIDLVAKNIESINRNKIYPTILITDGNQTEGNDFVYSFNEQNKVYPIVLGDTTTFLDLKIGQLNCNKYAFQKNKFPVEVFLQYAGTKTINAAFKISQGKNVLNSQNLTFSPSKKTIVLTAFLSAENVGLQVFKASISSTTPEKNTYNNIKNFAVEVVDQRTNVVIVSSINHPDIGALKRSIETNVQRKVMILKPSEIDSAQNVNVVVLYQPNAEFKAVYEYIKKFNINAFTVTGTATDFNFLNSNQTEFEFRMSTQKEDYLASFEPNFNLFAIDNIGFEQLPPLQNLYGTISAKQNATNLLSSNIRNIATGQPLLAFSENSGKRNAFLFGENSWKWRLQTYIVNKNFDKYDVFIDKTIQFLASNSTKKSLIVNHESFYNSGDAIEISAQYFNKNYEFDENAKLSIVVVNKNTKASKSFDLLKSNNVFKVNLDGLVAGQYSFLVKELNSKAVYNGYFEILDFDIEKQFVNPDLKKLMQVAAQTKGTVYMPNQAEQLIKTLLANNEYKAIEKEVVKKTPLVDWTWLLVLISFLIFSEWFLRKYHGML